MTRQIPIARPRLGPQERAAVDRVLRSGGLVSGPEVEAFESEFAAGVVAGRPGVAVSSGTAALHLGLLAAGIGPGDEVIVPSFTFAATANAVALTGATPVFVDVEERYFCLDVAAVEAAVGPRTRAVLAVHLYGHPADLTALGGLAQRYGLDLFEDAAQAHAATWKGRPVGVFGRFAIFSFYPTKNMTAVEGGMVSSADAELLRTVRLLRNQGMQQRHQNEIVGFNARMSDVHAAVGRVQLAKLAGWTESRRRNAAYLDRHLDGVMTPPVAECTSHVYHQYTIRVVGHDRDAFAAELKDRGVGTGVYYPVPVHRLPSFALSHDLPVTDVVCREVLSLPVHPGLSPGDLEHIVDAVSSVARAGC